MIARNRAICSIVNVKLLGPLTSTSLFLISAAVALAAAMTNSDVIKMTEAKLDETIILSAIQNSEGKFDTSSDGLIALSVAKVSPNVISTIIKRSSAANEPAAKVASVPVPQAAAVSSEMMSPSEVLMITDTETIAMQYITPQVRTAARGLGFGGVASYSVLRGTAASKRTKNPKPSFMVSVPNQAQPDSYLTIASFAIRKNNSREVLIGGGFMSYSSGIHPDRIINSISEKVADQSRAQKGFTIYKITPRNIMAPGEYAVILYTGEIGQVVATWFTGTGNSYFDFGVDR
jgi:hypothetical protein